MGCSAGKFVNSKYKICNCFLGTDEEIYTEDCCNNETAFIVADDVQFCVHLQDEFQASLARDCVRFWILEKSPRFLINCNNNNSDNASVLLSNCNNLNCNNINNNDSQCITLQPDEEWIYNIPTSYLLLDIFSASFRSCSSRVEDQFDLDVFRQDTLIDGVLHLEGLFARKCLQGTSTDTATTLLTTQAVMYLPLRMLQESMCNLALELDKLYFEKISVPIHGLVLNSHPDGRKKKTTEHLQEERMIVNITHCANQKTRNVNVSKRLFLAIEKNDDILHIATVHIEISANLPTETCVMMETNNESHLKFCVEHVNQETLAMFSNNN